MLHVRPFSISIARPFPETFLTFIHSRCLEGFEETLNGV